MCNDKEKSKEPINIEIKVDRALDKRVVVRPETKLINRDIDENYIKTGNVISESKNDTTKLTISELRQLIREIVSDELKKNK